MVRGRGDDVGELAASISLWSWLLGLPLPKGGATGQLMGSSCRIHFNRFTEYISTGLILNIYCNTCSVGEQYSNICFGDKDP